MIYKGEITMISDGRDHGRLGRAREFIEIGGKRAHNIVCSDYVNTFLSVNAGEFTLSTVKSGRWQIVMAIGRPNGEIIKDKGQLTAARVLLLLQAPVAGFVIGIPVGVIAGSFAVFLLVWLGIGFGYPLVKYSKVSKAANALDAQA